MGCPVCEVFAGTGPAPSQLPAETAVLPHTGKAAFLADCFLPGFVQLNKSKNAKGKVSLRGKVVVLEFWATWCGPCVAAIPHLNQLAEKFKDQLGLELVPATRPVEVTLIERVEF